MIDRLIASQILALSIDPFYSDSENDLLLVLNWLEPFFPGQFLDPSARIKLAIRSCLKTNGQHLALLDIYTSKILAQFRSHLFESYLFLYIIKTLNVIDTYYLQYLRHLNFNHHCMELFKRRIHALYYQQIATTDFKISAKKYFQGIFLLAANDDRSKYEEASHCIAVLHRCGFDDLVNSSIVQSLVEKIQTHIKLSCAGVWDQPCLDQLTDWVTSELFPIFSMIPNTEENLYDVITIAQDELVLIRILEIFDIVKLRKVCALEEIHKCLVLKPLKSLDEQRDRLVQVFIYQCQKLLLHSGINTATVIHMYASTIKSFLLIDPRGVLLDKVVRQIRKYLKSRNDVVPKIVQGLLAEEGEDEELSELASELHHPQVKSTSIDEPELHWVPDPIDALPDFKKGKVSDIVELLILIFDLKTIFTNEFTEHFGKKLLSISDYDISDISQSVELLKLKFGDLGFSTLDIMLRDIVESKKINILIFQNHHLPHTVFHSNVLSHLYWTMLPDETDKLSDLKIPKLISDQVEEFSKEFSVMNKSRDLKIIPQLGTVKLELEFADIKLYYEVTPLEASIICLFGDEEVEDQLISSSLKIQEICQKLETQATYEVSQALNTWVKHSVLLKDGITYTLTTDPKSALPVFLNSGSSGSSSRPSSMQLYRLKLLDEIWPFVRSMLSSLTFLSAEKVEQFLNVTLSKDQQKRLCYTTEIIEEYLDWCVDDDRLLKQDNKFALKPSSE